MKDIVWLNTNHLEIKDNKSSEDTDDDTDEHIVLTNYVSARMIVRVRHQLQPTGQAPQDVCAGSC